MNFDLWPAERLMLKHIATLQELETHYSIDDVCDRNEALDAWEDAEAVAREKKP